MKLKDRQAIYKQLEEYRKRPLIVYATSTRNGAPGKLAPDAVREFLDQIECLNRQESKSVDVLMHSSGGDPLVAWKLMATLRQHFTHISVIVPYMAMSAATIFALGADEIYMHRNASLGPIDPQITVTSEDGSRRNFAYEDVGAFLRFLLDEVNVNDSAHVTSLVSKLFDEVDPISVGAAKRASELSASIGQRLLLTHMKGPEAEKQAGEIAENLNKSFFAHGDTVTRDRAIQLKLKIMDEDPELESLAWKAYKGIEQYMKMRERYDHLEAYLKDEKAAKHVIPVPPLKIPSNAPEVLVKSILQAAANKAMESLNEPGIEVAFSLVMAVIESTRLASEYRQSGTLTGYRLPNTQIQLSATEREAGWRQV